MTKQHTRNQRMVMLRRCEQRRAQASLAKAHADLARLTQLRMRLKLLRLSMSLAAGATTTTDLRLVNSMADRLDAAHWALDTPLREANSMRNMHDAAVVRAAAKVDVAANLLDRSQRAAVAAQDLRRDAARMVRRPTSRLRLIKGDAT